MKNLPAWQSWHTELDEAATVAEYLPGPQNVQPAEEARPDAVEYMLAGQPWQVALVGAPSVVE